MHLEIEKVMMQQNVPGVTSFQRILISIPQTYRSGVLNDPEDRQDGP